MPPEPQDKPLLDDIFVQRVELDDDGTHLDIIYPGKKEEPDEDEE